MSTSESEVPVVEVKEIKRIEDILGIDVTLTAPEYNRIISESAVHGADGLTVGVSIPEEVMAMGKSLAAACQTCRLHDTGGEMKRVGSDVVASCEGFWSPVDMYDFGEWAEHNDYAPVAELKIQPAEFSVEVGGLKTPCGQRPQKIYNEFLAK